MGINITVLFREPGTPLVPQDSQSRISLYPFKLCIACLITKITGLAYQLVLRDDCTVCRHCSNRTLGVFVGCTWMRLTFKL